MKGERSDPCPELEFRRSSGGSPNPEALPTIVSEIVGDRVSQKELFERVRAPLKNTRWSWGAVRGDDGAVFLRVWQDETTKLNGKRFIRITANQFFQANDPSNHGYQERLEHVERVRGGAPLFLVMCRAMDPSAHPRQVGGFNSKEVFRGGAVEELDGEVWVELADRLPVTEA